MRLAVLSILLAFAAPVAAQSGETGGAGVPVDEEVFEGPEEEPTTPLTLSDEAMAATEEEEEDAADEDVVLPPAPRRGPSEEELEDEEEGRRAEEEPDGEPTVIDEDMELVPDPPDLPEWRLRAGAGVALPTAGDIGLGLRLTQDFEFQPRGAEPFLFGLGGSEMVAGADLLGQAHARIGLHAWFCELRPMRCQAAVAAIIGASFGVGNVGFDAAGETDLRLLFWDTFELHVRGGFFAIGGVAFINITGGLGVAF